MSSQCILFLYTLTTRLDFSSLFNFVRLRFNPTSSSLSPYSPSSLPSIPSLSSLSPLAFC
jgi:hypothetical protein